jgi:hypothetical protein
MGKKYQLPPTKAETAEERLEELISKELVVCYNTKLDYFEIEESKCRCYPDGFEAVMGFKNYGTKGVLHLVHRNALVYYNLAKEYEQNGKT